MKRALVPVLAFLVTAAVYAALSAPELKPRARRVRQAPTPQAVAIRAAEPAADMATRRQWRVGDHVAYDFEMALRVSLDGPMPSREDAPMVRLAGVWQVTVVRVADDVWLRAELADAVLTPTDHLAEAGQLGRAFQLRVARDGRLIETAFAPGTDSAVRQLLRQVAAAAQLSHRPGQTRWTVEEADATGRYVAEYRLDGAAIERTKPRYLSLASAGAVKPITGDAGFEVDSQTRFTLDRSGHPARIRTEERMTVTGDEVYPTLRSFSAVEFTLRGVGRRDASLAGDFVAEAVASPLGTDAKETERLDRDLLRDDTLESLVERMLDAETLEPSEARSARNLALPRLAAQFRLDPATIEDAKAIIVDGDTPEATMGTLVGALGATGTDASRDALIGLVAADQPGAVRAHTVTAMNLMENADAQTIGALTSLLDDDDAAIGRAAALALGGNARHADEVGDTDPVQVLLDRYAAAESVHAREVLIDALGNTGDPRAMPAIRDAVTTPALYEAAVFALRFMPDPTVDATLEAILMHAQDDARRLVALRTIAYRDLTAWQGPLVAMMEQTESEKVRGAIAGLLQR